MARGTLDKCCFCVDLRIGSLIIGYIQLLIGIAVLIFVFCSLSTARDDIKNYSEEIQESHKNLTQVLNDRVDDSVKEAEIHKTFTKSVNLLPKVLELIIMYYMVMMTLVFVGFNVSLLFGLHQSKPIYIKVFMIYMIILLAFNFLGWLISFASTNTAMPYVIGFPISILVFIFFLFNIRSYYYTMVNSSVENGITTYMRAK